MRFVSTGGKAPPADLETALLTGLAPDGGLYFPETVPRFPEELFARLPDLSREETALEVLAPYFAGIPGGRFDELVRDALSFPIPLVPLGDRVHVLELFHGPTLAFKDVGARFLARLFSRLVKEGDEPLTILVATSGDTGGAVARAFHGVPGTEVVVLYPKGKVSALQEKQFTTLGDNVTAFAVEGVFDDCQRMAKESFADAELRRSRRLTSANSINVGRFLPQSFYYFHALGQLGSPPGPVIFSTPSGNFGNLGAGLLARHEGLPAAGFVAATNVNDVVPEYLDTGEFRPRPSLATISNAMDVGDPSNFARILHLYGGDHGAILEDVRGSRHDDEETRAAIREVYETTGTVLDPHTAVGWLGLREALEESPDAVGIVLATAHPAKFGEEVEPVIGRGIPLPGALAECRDRESLAEAIPSETGALKERLLAG